MPNNSMTSSNIDKKMAELMECCVVLERCDGMLTSEQLIKIRNKANEDHSSDQRSRSSIKRANYTANEDLIEDESSVDDNCYKCKSCEYSTNKKSYLKRHELTHNGGRQFKCEKCSMKFNWASNLKSHMRTHADEFAFKCSKCGYGFDLEKEKNSHEKKCVSNRFECDICKYQTRLKADIIKHMFTHTDEKYFKCNICKYETNCKSNLLKHRNIHTVDKPFKCDLCDSGFAWSSNYRKHMRTHAKLFTYQCAVCNIGFNSEDEKNAHEKKCTWKRYQCTYCSMTTIYKPNFDIHMRIHTGEKPFKCAQCSQAFISQGTLNHHLKTVHIKQKRSIPEKSNAQKSSPKKPSASKRAKRRRIIESEDEENFETENDTSNSDEFEIRNLTETRSSGKKGSLVEPDPEPNRRGLPKHTYCNQRKNGNASNQIGVRSIFRNITLSVKAILPDQEQNCSSKPEEETNNVTDTDEHDPTQVDGFYFTLVKTNFGNHMRMNKAPPISEANIIREPEKSERPIQRQDKELTQVASDDQVIEIIEVTDGEPQAEPQVKSQVNLSSEGQNSNEENTAVTDQARAGPVVTSNPDEEPNEIDLQDSPNDIMIDEISIQPQSLQNIPNCNDEVPSTTDQNGNPAEKEVAANDTSFNCGMCGLGLVSILAKIIHENRCRLTKHQCYTCDYNTFYKADFEKHMRKHTGEKPFGCFYCIKLFSRKNILIKHIKRCHGKDTEA